MYEIKFHILEDKNTIIYWYSTYLDPTSTFGREDGQEKKSNIYKKLRLHLALCEGKWKKRKIWRWRRSEPVDEKKEKKKKGKIMVLGLGN